MRHRIMLAASLAFLAASAPAADGELHTFHCLFGCPLGAPATNDTVVREIYTLSSNDLTRMADWVAFRVTRQSIGTSENRNWKTDPSLSADEALTEDHYEGAPDALHVDRGHQAPLAAFSGTEHAQETNILSNITPQASALNQGPWQRLEGRERRLARESDNAVFVLTGPLFERLMRPMPAAPPVHRVPSGYWKIIALADGRVSAFVMDQNTPRRADFCASRTTVAEIQLRSRLFIFPMLGDRQLSSLDSALGCTTPSPAPAAPAEITTR